MKVSVIMPTYNAELFLKETIASILAQTYQNFELIIIDDGSTDNSKAVIDSFGDPRIKYLYQENHGGPSKARNYGLREATGKYIFIFDSDDLMRPDKIELSVAALEEHQDADILFTKFSMIDEKNNVLREDYLKEYIALSNLVGAEGLDDKNYFIESERLHEAVIKVNFIGTSSVALRASAITRVDVFDEELKNADDRLFWISFTKAHNGVLINKILHDYRVVNSGITARSILSKGPNKIVALEKAKKMCHKNMVRYLDAEISERYLNMSRECKNQKIKNLQRLYSLKSMFYKLNYKAFKLYISSFTY